MAAKKRAAKAGAGAVSVGKAVRSNEYVQRLIEDEELRESLRAAFESAKTALDRMSGKGPAKAIMDDKKTQRELREAASSLRDAADTIRGVKTKRKRRRRGGLLLVLVMGAGLALVLNEGLRKKALDLVFGEEEEFEYTSTTSGDGGGPSGGGGQRKQPDKQTAGSQGSGGS
jgi:adenylosuccinate synthase